MWVVTTTNSLAIGVTDAFVDAWHAAHAAATAAAEVGFCIRITMRIGDHITTIIPAQSGNTSDDIYNTLCAIEDGRNIVDDITKSIEAAARRQDGS
jgi:hypothetical protein